MSAVYVVWTISFYVSLGPILLLDFLLQHKNSSSFQIHFKKEQQTCWATINQTQIFENYSCFHSTGKTSSFVVIEYSIWVLESNIIRK